jgi:hypothetical protein
VWRFSRFPPAESGRPFVTLTRTFFAQFFASESVASEIQLRRAYVWVFVVLLLPGLFLLAQVFPAYQINVTVAVSRHQPERITAMLDQIVLLIVTYSMVTTGLVALFVWDKLAFDRRDAIVLGALPIRTVDVIGAKLAALGALLLGGSLAVNLMTAVPFGLTTTGGVAQIGLSGGEQWSGLRTLVTHFGACLATNLCVAVFIFAALVTLRGGLSLLVGERIAARLGSLLQFVFVVGLLCFLVVLLDYGFTPSASAFFVQGSGAATPTAWFVGLFEWLLGSRSAAIDALAFRALTGTALVVAGTVFISAAGYARQMQHALSSADGHVPSRATRSVHSLARRLSGRRGSARASVALILLTLARSRPHQALVAVNLAVGVAMAAAVLSRRAQTLSSLMHPRTATFWIPLLLAWWALVGLRAAFFVPSDLAAAWTFRFHAPDPDPGYWSAVRASLAIVVLPACLVLTLALLTPLVGFRIAAWHALVVSALVLVLVEVVAQTIDFIPFTRAYRAGHARLKSLWWLYLASLFAFADVPVKMELARLQNPRALAEMAIVIVAMAATLEWMGHRRAIGWSIDATPDEEESDSELTVLDLTHAVTARTRL